MLKNILNLDGAQKLSNNEQKEINGGITNNCGIGGFRSNVNSCLCNGGQYDAPTQSCKSGTPTYYVFENATGCCYTNMIEP